MQTTPSHSTNPLLVNLPLAPTMAAWYAPLVLPQPLEVSKEFFLNFVGTTSKVGIMSFTVSPETIAQET